MNHSLDIQKSKNMPLVSVIMGAYNCEKTLKRAIDSIRRQTYTNWEFIICDDCSTDKTSDILRKFSNEDSRIHIIQNKENCRLAASLNYCLSIAKGEYIARMDADDESLPQRFAKQVEFLNTHAEYACVGSGRIVFDENNNEVLKLGTGEARRETLLLGTPFAHPTIMMRKSTYDALGGYTSTIATMRAEDLDLWFRFFKAGYKGYNLEEPLYRYQQTLNDYRKRTLRAGIQTTKVYFQGYKMLGISWYKYISCLKPIVAAIIPNKIIKNYHSQTKNRGINEVKAD